MYKSAAQQRYLESDASPLTEKQKKEFRAATDFSKLPERVGSKSKNPPRYRMKEKEMKEKEN